MQAAENEKTGRAANVLHLSADSTAVVALFSELSDFAECRPDAIESLPSLDEALLQPLVVESECFTAAGANHLRVVFKPGDALLGLVAAARAGNIDQGIAE
jgi:hypothetical protein